MWQPITSASLHLFPTLLISWISQKLPGEDASTKDLKCWDCRLRLLEHFSWFFAQLRDWRNFHTQRGTPQSLKLGTYSVWRKTQFCPAFLCTRRCIPSTGDCLILANCYTALESFSDRSPWCGLVLQVTLNTKGSFSVQGLGQVGAGTQRTISTNKYLIFVCKV